MSQRELTADEKVRLVENANEHGTRSAFDLQTGARLGSSIRLASDIADVLDRLRPKEEKDE